MTERTAPTLLKRDQEVVGTGPSSAQVRQSPKRASPSRSSRTFRQCRPAHRFPFGRDHLLTSGRRLQQTLRWPGAPWCHGGWELRSSWTTTDGQQRSEVSPGDPADNLGDSVHQNVKALVDTCPVVDPYRDSLLAGVISKGPFPLTVKGGSEPRTRSSTGSRVLASRITARYSLASGPRLLTRDQSVPGGPS